MTLKKVDFNNLSEFRQNNIVDYSGHLGFDIDITIISIEKNLDDIGVYRLQRTFGEVREYDAQKSEIVGIKLREHHLEAAGFIRDPQLNRYILNGIAVGRFIIGTGKDFMDQSGILTKVLLIPTNFPKKPERKDIEDLRSFTYLHELQNYCEDVNSGIDFYPVNHYGLKRDA